MFPEAKVGRLTGKRGARTCFVLFDGCDAVTHFDFTTSSDARAAIPISPTEFALPIQIVGAVERTLWARVGPTVTRTCTKAAKPRRPESEPLRIEAGSADGLASKGT